MSTKFFNRELSWVEFNARVLNESQRETNPIFERLKFLAITESNFDEFFQVRVASLKRNPGENADILKKLSERIHNLTKSEYSTLMNSILPELAEKGIEYVSPENYSPVQKSFVQKFFSSKIFPLITPLRTDSPVFPHIGNLHLNAAFILEPINGIKDTKSPFAPDEEQAGTDKVISIAQIPSSISRIVWIPSSDKKKQFAVLDDIVTEYGADFFPGYKVAESMVFKICRDADFAVDEDSGDKFIEAMQEVLIQRQSSFVVRLICNSSSKNILEYLKTKLNIEDQDIYEVNSIIDPTSLMYITEIPDTDGLVNEKWNNFYPPDFNDGSSIWDSIRQKDILLHLPYQSFDPVVQFIQKAASDDKVIAIKMTLYRTSKTSPIVKALKEAAQNGKQVTVFVELKARFDEKNNISWAVELERAGAIVVYGIKNLKVHAKIALVIRRENDGIRRYAHISTGNYNSKTAKEYQDLGIFTANAKIVTDATMFFNTISGYSMLQTMHHLFLAPITLKSKLLELIEREIILSTPENPGIIRAKMNSLCHPEIIEALYRASKAGVKIELNVRGICTLIPGVKKLSENIRVVSVIDRYLEHSRIYYFKNGGAEELYLASADWMERNLDRRIELMFPIMDKGVFKKIKEILNLYFQDNVSSHILQKNGTWKQNAPEKKEQIVRVQEVLYKIYKKQHDMKKESKPTSEFIVRRK